MTCSCKKVLFVGAFAIAAAAAASHFEAHTVPSSTWLIAGLIAAGAGVLFGATHALVAGLRNSKKTPRELTIAALDKVIARLDKMIGDQPAKP